MQLADARLADTQDLTDFLEVQLFVVVQRQHQALTLRQVGDSLGQGSLEALLLQAARRFDLATGAILMQPFVLAVLQQVVEAEQAAAQGIVQDPVVIIETQLEFGSNFMIFSVTAGSGFHGTHRVTDHACVAVHRTRCPVALADFVEHGPADADAGVGFKAGALAGVVLVGHFQQADHAGLDQVLDLHVGRQPRQQVVSDALDQRGVALDQLVLGVFRRPAVHLEAAGIHNTGPALVGCTRRSTKNSRWPRGLAGSGQLSTFCAIALKASAHLERGKAS
ncbi:hypothetical protein D9M71_509060 [compost metagenome]